MMLTSLDHTVLPVREWNYVHFVTKCSNGEVNAQALPKIVVARISEWSGGMS